MTDNNAGLLQWCIRFLTKKTSGSGIKNENISEHCPLDLSCVAKISDRTRELAEQSHKPIIRFLFFLKKRKITLIFY